MWSDHGPLADAFARLRTAGRGDSARGRNLQALLLLDLCWRDEALPMAHYRPVRTPEAFLAMVFDVLGDFSQQRFPHEPRGVDDRLGVPLERFLAEVAGDAPGIASELGTLVRSALLDPRRSTLPTHLTRLPLYLGAEELALVDEARVVDALSMAEVFRHLGYRPPEPGPGSERHPVGRDLRKAFRAELDAVWSRALEAWAPTPVTLAACFPLEFLRLAERLPVPLPDFGFFYALATDAGTPGRRWRPPTPYIGAEDAREAFEALGRTPDTPLSRLGLSATLPRTIARFDAWLAEGDDFTALHAGRSWRRPLRERTDEIALMRLRFLRSIGEELT